MTIHTEDRGALPDEVPVGVTLDRTCVGCGTHYQWTSREGWQWPTEYCTRKCKRTTSPRRRIKLETVGAPLEDRMVLLICGRCEAPFGWTPRADATGTLTPPTYHSQACANSAHEKRKKDRKADAKLLKENRRRTAEQERQRREDEERTAAILAQSDAARELLLTGGRCVTCGKVASPTQADAKRMKREIEARAGRTNEVRYYQCENGWWHWTRMGTDLATWRAERLMTESPASLRHQGRGAWRALGDVR